MVGGGLDNGTYRSTQKRAGRAFFGDELFEQIMAAGEAKTKDLEDAGFAFKALSTQERSKLRQIAAALLEFVGEKPEEEPEEYPEPEGKKDFMAAVFGDGDKGDVERNEFVKMLWMDQDELDREIETTRFWQAAKAAGHDVSDLPYSEELGDRTSMAIHVFRGRKVA